MILAVPQTQSSIPPKGRMLTLGFTLIEMMIVLIILGVLIALVAPSFQNATLGSKLGAYANNFVASTYLARGEALKRNTNVVMCVSADGASCTTGNWNQGWIVKAGSTILQHQAALASGFSMASLTTPSTSSMTFKSTGIGSDSNLILVSRTNPSGNQQRCIKVEATGKASVSIVTTNTCS